MMMCDLYNENITFQELVDKNGLENVFVGTDVDEATQNIILDFFFDYELCSEENRFLRYFRRRLNEFYPNYMSELRVLTVKENFDPYVQNYFEEIYERNYNRGLTKKDSGTENYETSGNKTDTDNVTETRTPNLKTITNDTGNSNAKNTSTGESTRTPNLTTTSENGGSDKNTNNSNSTDTRNLTSSTEGSSNGSEESNSKNRSFTAAYPEANMSSFPTDIDSNPSLTYLSGESDVLSKTENSNTNSSNSETTDTGTTSNESSSTSTTEYGSTNTQKATGTENINNSSEDISTLATNSEQTVKQTGDEIKTTERNNQSNDSSNSTKTSSSNGDENENSNETTNRVQKGRNESVADLIPRVVKAIENSDPIRYLIDSLMICFNYIEM